MQNGNSGLFEKSKNRNILATHWPILKKFGMVPRSSRPPVNKILRFCANSRWWPIAIRKIENIMVSQKHLDWFQQIFSVLMDHFGNVKIDHLQFTRCSGVLKQNALTPWFDSIATAPISCKILVNIGPVVSAKNKITDGNCVACSRRSRISSDVLDRFSPNERVFGADDRSRPDFFDISRDVANVSGRVGSCRSVVSGLSAGIVTWQFCWLVTWWV